MNYQESLTRLEEEEKKLEEKVEKSSSSGNAEELDKRKLKLLKEVVKGYSISLDEEVSNDKIEQAFSKVYGFTKEKEEVKSLLLLQKGCKAEGIENPEQGKVLCFVGPPGVGKTYFASKFAEALGRKFHRVNLGGSSSAIIITGGEEMWVGAKQGEIINAIAKTQSRNPVVLLDEVEKPGKDPHHGTIENALLHILDPEQNQHFKDRFLDVEIDISQIIFILTANKEAEISDPLKNRLEIIKLKEYDDEQKLQIGKITIKKIFSDNYQNKNEDLFEMDEKVLQALIRRTKEPGVRQLGRKIKKIIRWCFTQWFQSLEKGEEKQKIIIDEDKLNELFEDAEKEQEEEEKDEETKLREKNEELGKEIEDLKKSRSIYGLTKPLEISQDKEFCQKCQQKTLQTTNKTCFLCDLEEQVEQFIATINKENWEKVEQIWQERKLEWMKQASDLQSGEPEEQEIGQHIKSSIRKIDKKLRQVKNSSSVNSQSKLGTKDYLLMGSGIIILFLGCLLGWIFSKEFTKKKKKQEVWQKIDHWKPTIPAPPTPRR